MQDPVLTKELSQAETDRSNDYAQWQCQLYGGAGCPPAGSGPLAAVDKQAYLADVQKVTALQKQIDAENKSAAASNLRLAKQDLAPATTALDDYQRQQAQLVESFSSTNVSNAGLLLRLQALDAYAAGSSTLEAARWLLFLFFTAIECLPILVKVLLNLGPENTYEKALARADQISLRLAEKMLPEIVQDTTAARMRVIRAKLARREPWETVGVNHDGWTSPDGLRQAGHPPYRPPAL